jgi:hypothetical protein
MAGQMTELWTRPEHPNMAAALGGYVGSGAPLVAGFELAAIVLLLTSDHIASDIPLAGPSIVAMVCSVMLMVFSIRYGFWAVSYWTTPDERIMWNPALLVDDKSLAFERYLLAGRLALFKKLRNRSEHLFQFGIAVFILAIALMLVPHHWQEDGTAWRWAATWVAAAALAVHLFWTAGDWLHRWFDAQYNRRFALLRAAAEAAGAANDGGVEGGRPAEGSGSGAVNPTRTMVLLKKADSFLLIFLAFIWPTARQPKPPRPGPASAAGLAGLRRDLPPSATPAGPKFAAGTNDVPGAPPVTLG